MPANLKVVYTQGVPVVADFAATDGAPLCVNALTGIVYYLAAGDVVTPISAGSTGTVTSVNLTAPTTLFTVSGVPITTAGTIAIALVSATGNLVLATPNGSTGNPSLRSLVDADVPDALTINGGTVNNTVIGGTTAAAATFTTVGGTTITASSTAKGATVYSSATATFANLVDISGASAGQIQFPASQNASSNANTLDDYEEGTWTPTDASGASLSFTTPAGMYTKIGNMCVVSGRLTYPSTADASSALIGSLPFTCANAEEARTGSLNYTTGATARLILVNANATTAYFFTATGGLVTNAQMSTVNNYFDFRYRV